MFSLSYLKTWKNASPCETHCKNTGICLTFSVLLTICSWLTAFSCFSLWLLEGSDILSLRSQSKIPFFSAQSNCVKRLSIHFYQNTEPCWGSSRSATRVISLGWQDAPTAPCALVLQLSERGTAENPTSTQMQLVHLGEVSLLVVCCCCCCFERQNKATQPCLREHLNSNTEFLSISPPWSNTQFVPFSISY